MPTPPPRAPRGEPREIAELRRLKAEQPQLASAVDMQVTLVDVERRVQARVPLPWIRTDPDRLRAEQAAGRPVVRFADIPLDWTSFRLIFRQTADALNRHGAIEEPDHRAIVALGREGHALEPILERWYAVTSRTGAEPQASLPADAPPGLENVLLLAIRPFLARSVEALVQSVDLESWAYGYCPFCGWEPDFAVITSSAERRLICGRCHGQWRFGSFTCPFCSNDDRSRITSFATPDGRYRVYACDACKRYLKAYDGRGATRPLMLAVDTIATLPLDAAAMQRGYSG